MGEFQSIIKQFKK